MKALLDEIERTLPEGGDWCSIVKAHALAAIIVGTRPTTIVEIGVWMGGSLIPMALACKHNGAGTVLAIDPWSPHASIEGQHGDNERWWRGVDHDRAFHVFKDRLHNHGLASIVSIRRARSDDVTPPDSIDLLHVDGNHAEQAIRDVERFCPHVRLGGIVVLDDLHWDGGHVSRAVERAHALGFVDLYPLDQGIVLQRRFGGAA